MKIILGADAKLRIP